MTTITLTIDPQKLAAGYYQLAEGVFCIARNKQQWSIFTENKDGSLEYQPDFGYRCTLKLAAGEYYCRLFDRLIQSGI